MDNDTKWAIIKMTPAIGGVSAYYGLTLSDWMALITIIYVVLQIGLLVPKYLQAFEDWREKKKKGCDR